MPEGSSPQMKRGQPYAQGSRPNPLGRAFVPYQTVPRVSRCDWQRGRGVSSAALQEGIMRFALCRRGTVGAPLELVGVVAIGKPARELHFCELVCTTPTNAQKIKTNAKQEQDSQKELHGSCRQVLLALSVSKFRAKLSDLALASSLAVLGGGVFGLALLLARLGHLLILPSPLARLSLWVQLA